MTNDFYIARDKGGNMPVRVHSMKELPKSHPYWIKYVDGAPRAYFGPRSVMVENIYKDSVWDYNKSEFVPIDNLINTN